MQNRLYRTSLAYGVYRYVDFSTLCLFFIFFVAQNRATK